LQTPVLSSSANSDAQPRASRSRKAEQLTEARDENTSAERLDALARKGGDIALAVAANPCTHPDTLDRLSRNVRRSVRAAVACNPNASMDSLVRWIPANPHGTRLLVYLTDGYGTFPSHAPEHPCLWVIAPGGVTDTQVPFGEVLRMH
jgi:hypothetical protein